MHRIEVVQITPEFLETMSEPPTQRPAPQSSPRQTQPPQNYPPQNYPPQNYPPRNYPPQNYPPQNYPQQPPSRSIPPQNLQPYQMNPTAPYPMPPQYRPIPRQPSEELQRDTEAAFAARMELGPEYAESVAANLAERVEELAEARTAELMTAADEAAITAQLQRQARGAAGIAYRCPCGKPAVMATQPRLPDGSPFPTMYYLTCPRAVAACSSLEAQGLMAEMNRRLSQDRDLAAAYRHDQ